MKTKKSKIVPGIKQFKLSELKPTEYNPRIISKDALAGLTNSIERFGCVEPIMVNTRRDKNTIIGGHQRYRALKRLKIKECICVTIDYSKEDEKLLNLALNNPYIQGRFIEGIADYIDKLRAGLSDKSAYLDLRIAELRGEIEEEKAGLIPDDDIPKPPKKAITKTGDLWILGKHRLLCGDSTKKENVKRLMGRKKADIVFTDPPYNCRYGESKNPRHKIRELVGDKQSKQDWIRFIDEFINIVRDVCEGDIYIWAASGPEGMRMRLALVEAGCHWSATIIWKKNRLILTPAKYQRIYESLFYGWFNKSTFGTDRKKVEFWEHNVIKTKDDIVSIKLCCQEEYLCPFNNTDIWEFDRPNSSELHPTMKPVDLCCRPIRNSSKKGDIIWDGFLGSGSTLIACEKLKRICYAMEIDPIYCDVAVNRWEQWTGKKAKRYK